MLYTFKMHFLFISLLLLPPLFTKAQDSSAGKIVNHNHTVNNNPTIGGASPVFNTEINPQFITNTQSTIHAIGVKIGDISVIIKHAFNTTINKENYDYVKQTIANLLWQYRYKIAGGALATSYSAMSLLLITDYHRIDNSMFWAYWKRTSTFEDLCAIPQKDLARELMLAIGEHHFNKDNPTDLAYPLITFIKDIEEEITTIKRYIATTKMLKQLYLMPLFPTNEKKLNRATKMLERVLFIKHIFLSWLADYNLTSTEKLNA
jgi:hypothetical protein